MGELFTKKETDFISKNYSKLTAKEIGNALGRSQDSISAKLIRLGLKGGYKMKTSISFIRSFCKERGYKFIGLVFYPRRNGQKRMKVKVICKFKNTHEIDWWHFKSNHDCACMKKNNVSNEEIVKFLKKIGYEVIKFEDDKEE